MFEGQVETCAPTHAARSVRMVRERRDSGYSAPFLASSGGFCETPFLILWSHGMTRL